MLKGKIILIIILIIVAIAILLLMIYTLLLFDIIPRKSISNIGIQQRNVHSISMSDLDMTRENQQANVVITYDGFETTDYDAINDCIQTLNSISLHYARAITRDHDYFMSLISGDTPYSTIKIYNKRGKILCSIDFYGELLWYGRGIVPSVYYRIDLSEYDKLKALSAKYGDPAH